MLILILMLKKKAILTLTIIIILGDKIIRFIFNNEVKKSWK